MDRGLDKFKSHCVATYRFASEAFYLSSFENAKKNETNMRQTEQRNVFNFYNIYEK